MKRLGFILLFGGTIGLLLITDFRRERQEVFREGLLTDGPEPTLGLDPVHPASAAGIDSMSTTVTASPREGGGAQSEASTPTPAEAPVNLRGVTSSDKPAGRDLALSTTIDAPRRVQLQPGSEKPSRPHPSLEERAVEAEIVAEETDGIVTFLAPTAYPELKSDDARSELLSDQIADNPGMASSALLKAFLEEREAGMKEFILGNAAAVPFDQNVRTLLLTALAKDQPVEVRLAGVYHAFDADPDLLLGFRSDPEPAVREEIEALLDEVLENALR